MKKVNKVMKISTYIILSPEPSEALVTPSKKAINEITLKVTSAKKLFFVTK